MTMQASQELSEDLHTGLVEWREVALEAIKACNGVVVALRSGDNVAALREALNVSLKWPTE